MPVSIRERVLHELREIGLVSAFFLLWFLFFLSLKSLVLAEYQIRVAVVGAAVIGGLVVAKVVVLLQKTSVGTAFRSSFVGLHVLWRSLVYTAAVFLVLLGERLFDAYREHGALSVAASELWAGRDLHHALATTLSIGLAFVVFHGAAEVDRRLGEGGLRGLFLSRRRTDAAPGRDAALGASERPEAG